jgi:alanyl-tRNA synthetase
MTSNEIRQQFLDFFKDKDHRIVPSAPVVPYDDPTLLFTNAGMNQFKDVFLGSGTREYKRAADTQKCIRVSGKHNDLEEVGHDTYHHTFFEMLGNWSFGDYYKKEAIKWAWELLTEVWKLPKERLWATVYKTDEEALELWKSETDIKHNHILKFAEKDNFWEMGETGPCGPCSEIHINLSDDLENAKLVNAGSPLCIEIWNLVFIQYNRDAEGKLHDLPMKHVDTGMGFERVCAVLQKKGSNYDSDVFTPLINAIEKLAGIYYNASLPPDDSSAVGQSNIAMRVIADHIRTLTFAIADGAYPDNKGKRGGVLIKILQRASLYGRKIKLSEPFLFKLVKTVVDNFSHVFPEIMISESIIEKIIKAEEENFNRTLNNGFEEYSQVASGSFCLAINERTPFHAETHLELEKHDWEIIIDQKSGANVERIFSSDIKPVTLTKYNLSNVIISGEDVFRLKDTHGFPEDLIKVMAREQGFSIDEKRFDELLDQQRERARKDRKKSVQTTINVTTFTSDVELEIITPTEFTGYDELRTEATIIGNKKDGNKSLIVLDRSPFYVESGGQIGDKGNLIIGDTHLRVIDVTKINNQVIHIAENESGVETKNGTKVTANVDVARRWDVMRNHSATHFLHKALRTIVGQHVQQAGSYVGPDRLRFDFTHFEKVKESELEAIESLVNEKIRENLQRTPNLNNIPFEQAKKMGALMFFGDKYGDKVNVVQFGDFTMEFCGGTHVRNSSEIGLLKIISESSIASGVRRIEAVTGAGVEKYLKELQSKIDNDDLRIIELLDEKKKLEKELAELKLQSKLGGIDAIVSSPVDVNGIKVVKGKVEASNMDELKSMGDELREKIKSGVGVLISELEGKVGIVAVVSDDLIKEKKMSAGKIVGELAKIVGGGGGGRPHLATAGGKDVSKINDALAAVESILSSL